MISLTLSISDRALSLIVESGPLYFYFIRASNCWYKITISWESLLLVLANIKHADQLYQWSFVEVLYISAFAFEISWPKCSDHWLIKVPLLANRMLKPYQSILSNNEQYYIF